MPAKTAAGFIHLALPEPDCRVSLRKSGTDDTPGRTGVRRAALSKCPCVMAGKDERNFHRGRTMRRTIKTLMFLAVGGLASLVQAADHSRADSNWQYYAAGQSSYKVSDDDETEEAPAKSGVVMAGGAAATNSAEQNALYTPQG